MAGMVADLEPVAQRMAAAAGAGFSTATDLADWLVRELGLPFRDAHHITGAAVKRCEALGCDLPALPLADLQALEPRITEGVYKVLTPAASVASRTSYGGTAPRPGARPDQALEGNPVMTLRTLIRTAAALVIVAAPLAACGKLGGLERPGPLNGADRSTDRQAEERRRQAQDPQRPVDTIDPRDRSIDRPRRVRSRSWAPARAPPCRPARSPTPTSIRDEPLRAQGGRALV